MSETTLKKCPSSPHPLLPEFPMKLRELFEDELLRRGLIFRIDPENGGYSIAAGGGTIVISIKNLEREFATDGDTNRVVEFVDAIQTATELADDKLSADQLYWCLEPNDYQERAEYRVPLSDRVDRVLAHLSSCGRFVTWVTSDMLSTLGLPEPEAAIRAFENLSKALGEAKIDAEDMDGVQLGIITTTLPFKTSLMLAPNLKEIVGASLGWPLLGVAPDRDFLFLWDAKHADFAQRVGPVVVREFSQRSHPISTEVWEINDGEIRALGEFPTDS